MGAWGIKAIECDKAQDWLLDLWEEFPLYQGIEKALNLDPEFNHEEVRMAANMLLLLEPLLGIPPQKLGAIFDLAILQMRKVKENDVFYDEEEFHAQIAAEIDRLVEWRENSTYK